MLKNNMNPFKVLIISCWILLGIAFVLKFFGVDWFLVGSDNQCFIKMCDYVDNNKILYNLLPIIFNITTTTFYFMAILKQNRPHLLWFIILIVYASVKVLFYNQIAFIILDFVITLILPIILYPHQAKSILAGVFINLAFQFISLFTKFNKYDMYEDKTLIMLLLNIDYLIMLVLYWLYRIKNKDQEVQSNG